MLSEFQIQQTFTGKNILFGVLNWGLGHASRMVPLINTAIKYANCVVICSNGNALLWLKKYYPGLTFIECNSPDVKYGSNKMLTYFNLFKLYAGYSKIVNMERTEVSDIIKQYEINLIVSDNRPGIYNSSIYSIYLTHQLYVKAPFSLSYIASKLHANFYKPFNEIWVPDFESSSISLAGKLSRNYFNDNRIKYIGPLSRFINLRLSNISSDRYDLAILSGPEPQRSILENKIIKEYLLSNKNLKLVRGVFTRETVNCNSSSIEIINNACDSQLVELFSGANKIICRSGYSSVMDLFFLNQMKKAEFIPTPGQTEQEYLASYLANMK